MPEKLSIDRAINLAQLNDPWLEASQFNQHKLAATAVAAGQLDDPKVSLGVANIGADRFDFNQEPMTQLKVGLTQMFPRGNTRSIKTERFNLMAHEQPILRENRLALLKKQVSIYWLDAYQAQVSISLIEQDRPLFEQLIELVTASYSSGFGQSRQQDLIRAELELTRLDDRLNVLNQGYEEGLERLKGLINHSQGTVIDVTDQVYYSLGSELPAVREHDVLPIGKDELLNALSKHPAVKAMDVQIQAEYKGVELAKQKYKPAWGLNASYGYRDDTANNINRADLFSIGLTFELPIFTKNRQDQGLKAALNSVDSKESQKTLLLRELLAAFDATRAQLFRLNERSELYEKTLLPQMKEQAEASLNAYTHDDGDFAEVIRARIAQLNAQIEALSIKVNVAKAHTEINYLLSGRDNSHPQAISSGEQR
ncbi:TolC family protein [Marinicella sp. S1101]|uniref:TolC family protein n=1 Tax=Marinicella marina TaxID=2996016 RepID=UPI00226099F9|nr:TolC family protein [Marinicella marina]MCX7553405.1 TolC family protein [Marinicella marina]MDJ1140029.1 TolC family protein [Marinicella marina]